MVEKTKILITGSKGMLGSKLCQVLADEYEVFGLDLLATRYSLLATRFFTQCDITDKDKVVAAIKSATPNLIIHTAAYTDVDGCELNPEKAFAVNAKGTENVARAAKEIGATLFYISTDYVFDGKGDKPYTEADTPNPINTYGQSKLEGERIIQSLLEKYFILRSSWLFGPSGKNFVTTILQKAGERKTLKVVDDQIGSPTYTLDLADAVKSLLAICYSLLATNYGIYHITNRGSCSWYEFAQEIVALKRLATQILPVTSKEIKRPAQRPRMSVLDNSKVMNTFNLRLRHWSEALRHFYEKINPSTSLKS
jgi:dTDP-4-dehydrorhamnose reductase